MKKKLGRPKQYDFKLKRRKWTVIYADNLKSCQRSLQQYAKTNDLEIKTELMPDCIRYYVF